MGVPRAAAKKLSKFDTKTFLSTINGGRKIAAFSKKQIIFVQGGSSDGGESYEPQPTQRCSKLLSEKENPTRQQQLVTQRKFALWSPCLSVSPFKTDRWRDLLST